MRKNCIAASPDNLYTATPLQRFVKKCTQKKADWAVFSDKHGVWFPYVKHEWYEKDPNTVTDQEFKNLIADFDEKLRDFTEIWFYYNPGRFHPLYQKLLESSTLKNRIRKFTHIEEIS